MYKLLDLPVFDSVGTAELFTKYIVGKNILKILNENIMEEDYTLYALIDGAMDKEIEMNLDFYHVSYSILYPSHYSKEVGYAQPFLVNLDSSDDFKEWFLERAYGNSRAIFILSQLKLQELTLNLKPFCLGYIEERNKETFFRFYDSKLFPTFLRIISENQVQSIFKKNTYYLSENIVLTEEIDIFYYNNEEKNMYKSTYNLLDENTISDRNEKTKIYKTAKHKDDYYLEQDGMIFTKEDITLLSHSKEYVYVKQACLSLIQQVKHIREKKLKLNDIYAKIFKIATEGIDRFALTDKDINYLWIVVTVLGIDIDEVLEKDSRFKIAFNLNSTASQSYKGLLLEELIFEREEMLKKEGEHE